jgi:ribA/ribD-fused uncharacterized protein
MIKFYKVKDPHGYMSNFYPAKFYLDGKWWKTTEAYYQAMKTENVEDQEKIRNAKTPKQARDLGQKVEMHKFFKDEVMYDCVLAKFVQNHDIREYLLKTGDEELIEDSSVDAYWGCGADGTGKNMLGKILMEVREELRQK